MNSLSIAICAGLALLAAPLWAANLSEDMLARMRAADVVLLGEVHDNPGHHAMQAAALEALRPAAVVWEMLTPGTAAEITARFQTGWPGDPESMAQALQAAAREWSGFEIYRAVLEASRGSAIHGALVPRRTVRTVVEQGVAGVFGAKAAEYGLTMPLAPADRAAREAEQMAAHCDAMPGAQMPLMVDIQRLRDAVLARTVVAAMDATGGPVAVITGNGHARTDHAVPGVLARVRPGLRLFALGQSEDGAISGSFDAVLDSPAVDRPDPCAVFARPSAGGD